MLRLYNIWHHKLFDELYEHVDVSDGLVMYAVNNKYPKLLNHLRGYKVTYEFALPLFEPRWQELGYCQTSCMMHVYKNKLHSDLDYIGFIQYDMRVARDALSVMRDQIRAHEPQLGLLFHSQLQTIRQKSWMPGLEAILAHYNGHFQSSHGLAEIQDVQMPILHTFAIPVAVFDEMMQWIIKLAEDVEATGFPYRISRAEFFEVAHGLYLGLWASNNKTKVVFSEMPVEHVWPLYHNQTDFDGYKQAGSVSI